MTERKSLFRAWLVDRVSEAKLRKVAGQSLEDRARYLGVQPDVLVEADQRRLERVASVGRFASNREVHGRAAHDSYTCRVRLYMPIVIAKPFDELCQIKGVTTSMLGRAIVQTLLLSAHNPRWYGTGWLYKGKFYTEDRLVTDNGNERSSAVSVIKQFVISTGADIALRRRAERAGCTKTALVRGAIIDLLEGHTGKLVYADTASMYNDPDRYPRGP